MIIIFGTIGSGKTEQGERLARRLNCPRVSSSQLLRASSDRLILKQIAEGTLVGDQSVMDLLEAEFKKIGADKKEFILDGFPRSVAQAQWLASKIKAGVVKFTAIIYLQVPEKEIMDRLLKRGREDDKEDIIRHRLNEYDKNTQPVLDYLRQAGYQIEEVDGSSPPDEVEKNISRVLGVKNES